MARLTEAHLRFLRDLVRWTGAATPRELGPQTSQEETGTRQFCKRHGFAQFDGHYWRITDAGRAALSQEEEGR